MYLYNIFIYLYNFFVFDIIFKLIKFHLHFSSFYRILFSAFYIFYVFITIKNLISVISIFATANVN